MPIDLVSTVCSLEFNSIHLITWLSNKSDMAKHLFPSLNIIMRFIINSRDAFSDKIFRALIGQKNKLEHFLLNYEYLKIS